MKTMMYSIVALGCVAIFGIATIAYPEEMVTGAENIGRILTINFIGQHSSAVALHYRVSEEEDGTGSAMILIESLKRKLAEKGFEHQPSEEAAKTAVHGYSVFIVGDTGGSREPGAVAKREGDLMVIIVENEKLAAVNTAPAQEHGLEYRQIENMADEIVTRLLSRFYI